MPIQPSDTQVRLNTLTTCFTIMVDTLEILSNGLQAAFLAAIANTTRSLLKNIETVKKNKRTCVDLMEQTHELLNAIIILHIKSETGGVLSPGVLNHIGRFTQTLQKIHTFVEFQQSGSKVKQFFYQGEMSTLLKDCKNGLTQGLGFFRLKNTSIMTNVSKMQAEAKQRHQEVLGMINGLSDTGSSDRSSMMSRVYSLSHNSSTSISMLPSEPKIFHGRESELSDIMQLLGRETPRIAILGTGGMGKTSLARAVLHHVEISTRYTHHRYFVACDSAANKVELAALIGAHLGLKPGKDLTQAAIEFFATTPPSLLMLDNLETVWEPADSRCSIEEFLSLLTDVDHLALMITMRGAERPAKVEWSHPFLPPLSPLKYDAAHQTFIDIAEDHHNQAEVDKILTLTDNMPLAITLMAHLVDSEGCSSVLSRWEEEKTSLISDGYDKQSNLDLSISLSLSSPRIKAIPHAQDLLSLLSMLPDGLSDIELRHSNIPIDNILGCKTALIRTALAYQDEQKRLKALVPIREYMQKAHQPSNDLIRPLMKYFHRILEVWHEFSGTQMGSQTVAQISSNVANIQTLLQNGLHPDHPDLKDSIICTLVLNSFSRITGQGVISLLGQLDNILPYCYDHQLEAYFMIELFASWIHYPISDPGALVVRALENFEHFKDAGLKSKFYNNVAQFYCNRDPHTAMNYSHMAISLANLSGDTKRRSQALHQHAFIHWQFGSYLAARLHACEAQRLARISADFLLEARALRVEAMSWTQLGNYKQSTSLCTRARDLLALCGMSGGSQDHSTMTHQAQIHLVKSEYHEAHNIQSQILQECPLHWDPYEHGLALLNLAEIGLFINAPKDDVQRDVEKARKIFHTKIVVVEQTMCAVLLADLHLREGKISLAETLFKQSLAFNYPEINSYCLERLGDVCHWGAYGWGFRWPTVYLAHSLKFKEKLGIYKTLQFLGDSFLAQADEDTAVSLFSVALEGFTYMDVHRSRAECMLRLGHISKGHGDLLKAVEFWDAARPLFERSSQTKQMQDIDERLASVGKDVLEWHRMHLAHLAKINAPTDIVEEAENNIYRIEDLPEDLVGVVTV